MHFDKSHGQIDDECYAEIRLVCIEITLIESSHKKKIILSVICSSFDIRRHIACEVCHSSVHGGFDSEMNQIIVCQNNTDADRVPSILTHEMVHMYDYCKNNLDFQNIDQLACTEVRAANLAHCTFVNAIMNGESSLLHIKQGHQVSIPFFLNFEAANYNGLYGFVCRTVSRPKQCNL